VEPAPEVDEVVVASIELGDAAHRLARLERVLDLPRERRQLARDLDAVVARQAAMAAEQQRQQRQHRDLARERLGRGDADLGAGVDVDAAVRLARDRGADDVDDAQRLGATTTRLAHGRQRVDGLARLGDHQHQRALVDDRVAVAELGGVLHLDRDARELLEHVLADQPRVPRRAAAEDDDAAHVAELLRGEVQAAQARQPLAHEQAAAGGVPHRVGLLHDLLQHEVLEAALFDLGQVPVDVVHFLFDALVPIVAVWKPSGVSTPISPSSR
jgi:hypothetical protein